MMASALDAIIGAIYKDGREEALRVLMEENLGLNYFDASVSDLLPLFMMKRSVANE